MVVVVVLVVHRPTKDDNEDKNAFLDLFSKMKKIIFFLFISVVVQFQFVTVFSSHFIPKVKYI